MRKVHDAIRYAKREILHCDDQPETLVLAIGAGKERLVVSPEPLRVKSGSDLEGK